MQVRAKKYLGQHFLTNQGIAQRIVDALAVNDIECPRANVIEVGCGMGVLTKYLLERKDILLKGIEIDTESIEYLRENFSSFAPNLYEADFLKIDLRKVFPEGDIHIIGNFPYNISSQIFFKVLDCKEYVPQVVGMLQREVAQRIASPCGNKDYGILSVLLKCWYDNEYLFTVGEGEFSPPPKVKSAVVRLNRNSRSELPCPWPVFKNVVKSAFNHRRKTLRNSLKSITADVPERFASLRPEQLSVEDFIVLATEIYLNSAAE